MFEHEDIQQSLTLGRRIDPSFINIRSLVKNNSVRIENRVMSIDKTVGSDHVIVSVLSILNLNPFMSYDEVEWRAKRFYTHIGNSFRFTSTSEFGKMFNSTVIKGQDDLIYLTCKDINPNTSYRKMSPLKFLLHDYHNLDWCIGTTYVADAVNILELNLVALAWQYVLYLRSLNEDVRKLPINVYVYRYVVFRALPSYFNLSMYNRHIKYQLGEELPYYQNSRDIPIPQLDQPMEKHVKVVNEYMSKANLLPVELLNNLNFAYRDVNLRHPNAVGLICDVKQTRTNQERWLYQLVNFKLAADILSYKHPACDKFKPRLKRDLNVFRQIKVVDKMPKHLSLHIKSNFLDNLEKHL